MPAKNLYYHLHQRFYDNFSIFRAKGVRSYGCFTYKVYHGHKAAVLPVLTSERNIKLVDHDFFICISEKVEKSALPLLTALLNKVHYLERLSKKLFFESYQNRQAIGGFSNNLEVLQGILLDYRHNVQQKLMAIFQKPYKDSEGCHFYPVTGDEIEKLIGLMVSLEHDFKNSIGLIEKQYNYKPVGKKEATLFMEINDQIQALRSGCKKLLLTYEAINCWCRSWLPVRKLHERQEILN